MAILGITSCRDSKGSLFEKAPIGFNHATFNRIFINPCNVKQIIKKQ